MKYFNLTIFYFLASILFFTGCATKQTRSYFAAPQEKQTILPVKSKTQDEESNEFEDEFAQTDADDIVDPLSGYNKIVTSFNDQIFTYALDPLSRGYATVIPEHIRKSFSNLIHNIQFPIRFTNNLLQGKFQNSSDELERFIVNSTVGIGGLFDPANTYMKVPAHNEDFGQTLGHYGVGAGFHIVLPFFGPSNVRDVIGLTADGYTSPLVYQKGLQKYKVPRNYGEAIGIKGFEILNKNSLNLDVYETLKKDALELYPFLRDVYEQKRTADIKE